jgi:hypothetical protein
MKVYYDDEKDERRDRWAKKKGSKKNDKKFLNWDNPRYPRDEEVEDISEEEITWQPSQDEE